MVVEGFYGKVTYCYYSNYSNNGKDYPYKFWDLVNRAYTAHFAKMYLYGYNWIYIKGFDVFEM